MKLHYSKLLLILPVLVGLVCLVFTEAALAKKRVPFHWIQKVNLEANILFDDQTLGKVVDLGGGIKMTPEIMELLVSEVEGFYSSQGHFLVTVDIPKKRSYKGVLKLRVLETEDIMAGNGEEERAKREVEKLIKVTGFKVDKEKKAEVIRKLVQGYKTMRLKKAETK